MTVTKNIVIRTVLIAGMMAVMFSAGAQNRTYIVNHRLMATLLSQSYGIPANLILAVATVESAGGNGPAARVLHNHFGIVGNNELVNNKGHKSRYKQYRNEISSYIDFCKLMTRKRFYKKLKNNTNTMAWIKAMSTCHYSEAPEEWEQKVISVLHVIKTETDNDFLSSRLAIAR